MRKLVSLSVFLTIIVLVGCQIKSSNIKRIQPWSENAWFWQYNGEPIMLLGCSSDDNLFQWPTEILIPHLDSMKEAGANYVRNTMSDRPDIGFELYPFLQLENGKYDLEQWGKDYWKRFDFFLSETEKRDIIVQIEVWDRFDYARNNWSLHPYNPKNNVNYTVTESGLDLEYPDHPRRNKQPFFFTTPEQQNNEVVLKFQQKYVKKMLSYSLKYDHILYCIDNETSAEEEWAIFWTELIMNKAEEAGRNVCITEMWDNWDLKTEHHKRTFDHPERYAFCDVSQNNQQKGQMHWDNFQWVRNYISTQPRPLNTVKTYGNDRGNHGSNKDGIERWWRHIIGGAATARFHRPNSGLGLSKLSMASVSAARKIESVVKFWELLPGNKLLSSREENEAYLTSKPGEVYIIYFTGGGEVSLDLIEFDSEFKLKLIELITGEWSGEETVNGGRIVNVTVPGSNGWVAVIFR